MSAKAADNSVAQRDQLRSSYATQLRDLAAWCDAHDLKPQAELTRNWLPRRNPTMSYIFTLPEISAAPEKLVACAGRSAVVGALYGTSADRSEGLIRVGRSGGKGKSARFGV